MSKKQVSADSVHGFDISEHIVSEKKAMSFSIGRGTHPKDVIIRLGDVRIGGKEPVYFAGPCAVDDRDLFLNTVKILVKQGIKLIRANLYKFRTYASSFQGLHEQGLDILREAKEKFGVYLVTEVLDSRQIEILEPVVDIYQVGSRSMDNTALLGALGQVNKPVLLKRMYAANVGEFLAAAEYIAQAGNSRVILCERGIRSFEPWTRFLLDVPGIALLRKVSPLPVIADISHSLGRIDLAIPVARAALAAGANGLMVEVHQNPKQAKSDAHQQMTPGEFAALVKGMRSVR